MHTTMEGLYSNYQAGKSYLERKTSLYFESLQNRKGLWANEILNWVVPALLLENYPGESYCKHNCKKSS